MSIICLYVGTDGIYSTTYKIILDEDDPADSPWNTGAWIVMTLDLYAKSLSSLGEWKGMDLEDTHDYS